MKQEDLQLDLSVETLALLGQDLPAGPVGVESVPIRSCNPSGSECSPPRCCP